MSEQETPTLTRRPRPDWAVTHGANTCVWGHGGEGLNFIEAFNKFVGDAKPIDFWGYATETGDLVFWVRFENNHVLLERTGCAPWLYASRSGM